VPKTGKLPPQFHPKTLPFSKYLTGELPSLASKVFREYLAPDAAKLMYGNDEYGDCVWAAAANLIILTSSHTGNIVIPTLDDVLGAYSAVTGFDPKTGANDNGTVVTQALEYLRTTGMAGHKILGWAQIDHKNQLHRELGVDYFGATFVGVRLPNSAQIQFASGGPWEVTSDLSIDGGHAILHPGYGYAGDDYVTWARWDQKASAEWSSTFIDEEYVLISDSWFDAVSKKTPMGLDLATLEADLKAISA
jgi:hypothetical protein